MRFDQPPRPSPSIVPSPEKVAAFTAELRARAEKEVAAAFGLTKSAAVPQLISGAANTCAEPEWIWPDPHILRKQTAKAPNLGALRLLIPPPATPTPQAPPVPPKD